MTPNENQPAPSHGADTEPTPEAPIAPADPPDGTAPRPEVGPDQTRIRPTRISGTWVAVAVAAVVLIFLLIFILQNLASATVHYLGAVGTLPLGVALLLAAVGGALLVALVGTARIVQLRRLAKRRGTSSAPTT
jgi:uncharacterized integral membrane protein